jgi:hypothetical protein
MDEISTSGSQQPKAWRLTRNYHCAKVMAPRGSLDSGMEREETLMTNDAPMHEVQAKCQEWLQARKITVAHARVWAQRDARTGQIEVTGDLCVAPDEHTILLYPVHVWRWGYWNKTQIRKEMAAVKKELVAEMAKQGYTKAMLTEPIEVKDIRYL